MSEVAETFNFTEYATTIDIPDDYIFDACFITLHMIGCRAYEIGYDEAARTYTVKVDMSFKDAVIAELPNTVRSFDPNCNDSIRLWQVSNPAPAE
jgi:hypothetical protein